MLTPQIILSSLSAFTVVVLIFCGFPADLRTPNLPDTKPAAQESVSGERYHMAWQLLKDHYLYANRLPSWTYWKSRLEAGQTDSDQTLKDLIESLGDKFTYMYTVEKPRDTSRMAVTWQKLSDDVGYIKIHSFRSPSLLVGIRLALNELAPAKALILDVRGNQGGFVELASRACAFFLREGTIATLIGRYKGAGEVQDVVLKKDQFAVSYNGASCNFPREKFMTGGKRIIVLANHDTRSAAEMFAAALRQVGGATIVGSQTYGKAAAQNSYLLDENTVLKIVTARIYMPNGKCMHGKGLTPDLLVDGNGRGDNQLASALDMATSKALAGRAPAVNRHSDSGATSSSPAAEASM